MLPNLQSIDFQPWHDTSILKGMNCLFSLIRQLIFNNVFNARVYKIILYRQQKYVTNNREKYC